MYKTTTNKRNTGAAPSSMTSGIGTQAFTAPECLITQGKLSKAADVYSFGITSTYLHVVLCFVHSQHIFTSTETLKTTAKKNIFHLCSVATLDISTTI